MKGPFLQDQKNEAIMEIINGTATNLRFDKLISSNSGEGGSGGGDSITYYAILEINRKIIVIKSYERISIKENDTIAVAGFNSDYGFQGWAYRNFSSGYIGDNWYKRNIIGGIICLLVTTLINSFLFFSFIIINSPTGW